MEYAHRNYYRQFSLAKTYISYSRYEIARLRGTGVRWSTLCSWFYTILSPIAPIVNLALLTSAQVVHCPIQGAALIFTGTIERTCKTQSLWTPNYAALTARRRSGVPTPAYQGTPHAFARWARQTLRKYDILISRSHCKRPFEGNLFYTPAKRSDYLKDPNHGNWKYTIYSRHGNICKHTLKNP